MWEAGQLKEASMQQLEGANTLHRIGEALVELNCRAATQQVHCYEWTPISFLLLRFRYISVM